MGAQSLDQSISRLAQYRPFSAEGRDLRAVLSDLVLAAAVEADSAGAFESLAACQEAFRVLWGLDVELEELRAVRDELVAQGRARATNGGLVLTPETLAALEATKEEAENVRKVAFGEWAEQIRTSRPDLTDEDLDELSDDLGAWLDRIIARHGVEAALILYPESPRAKKVFEGVDALGFSFLPEREPRLSRIREGALQAFVKRPSPAQRTFLADRLNTAYFLTVLSLDPAAKQLVQDRVHGHRVYLDTNVLYAVLGLSKPQEAISALRLLDLTRDLGYELRVTPWTMEELRTSLTSARKRVERMPLPRRELAHLLATASDEKSVVAAFWAAYRDKGTRPKDFFDFYDHFETLLEGHGIKVVDEGVTAIEQDRSAIDEQIVLLERQMGGKWKEDPVMEHDVKHRLLVDRLRGTGALRFSNARYWFLTRDGKLPPYALMTSDGTEVSLPFCVATSAWLQVMRSFTPRTEDLDRTVVDLLASPYIQARKGLPAVVVEEVVGRVDQFEKADPRLATEVLTDTALVADIARAKTRAERVERVDRALEKKAGEMRELVEEAEKRQADMQMTAAAALQKAEEEAAALELERTQRRILEAELDRERRERAEAERELEERVEEERKAREAAEADAASRLAQQGKAATAEVENVRAELRDFKRTVGRGLAAAAIVLLAVGGAFALLGTGTVTAPALVVVVVTLALLLVLLALRLVIGAKRGDTVAAWVFGILSVAAFVWFLVDKAGNESPAGPTDRPAEQR